MKFRRCVSLAAVVRVVVSITFLLPSFVSSEEVHWISGTDGSWHDSSNWDLDRVPGELDNVWIQQANNPVVAIENGLSASVHSLRAETPLVIRDNARLTLTAPSSISSSLEVDHSRVTVTGSEASFRADGSVALHTAFLRAESGGTISISQLHEYDAQCDTLLGSHWEANGAGSLIQFPSLESMNVVRATNADCEQRLDAHFGGHASFPALQSFDGEVYVFATEPESVIDLPALKRSYGALYEVRDGARIEIPALEEVEDGVFYVTDAPFSAPSLTTASRSYFIVTDTEIEFPALVAAQDVSLHAKAATVSLPQLHRLRTDASHRAPRWTAEGDGSRIVLPSLESIEPQAGLTLEAVDGAEILLPQLGAVEPAGSLGLVATGGGQIDLAKLTDLGNSARLRIDVRDAGSIIDISMLTDLRGSIEVRDGGVLLWSSPTELYDVQLSISEDANISTDQLRSITGGSITSYRPLPNVDDIDGSAIVGAAVLPAVTHFEANGAHWSIGDVAYLPNLMTISTEASTQGFSTWIQGGTLNVPALTTLRGTAENFVVAVIYGAASRFVAPSLMDMSHSVLRVRSGTAVVSAPTATQFTQSSVVVDEGVLVGNIDLSHGSELIGRGIGHIDGNVLNSNGLISPGRQSVRPQYMGFDNYEPQGDVASMTIHGNWIQTGGTTIIHLQGDSQSERHDQLIVSETASLGGTLELLVTSDYAPQIGDIAQIVVAQKIEGRFQHVLSSGFVDPEMTFAVLYGEQTVQSRVSLWGDVNFDNRFDSRDLISVVEKGEYEDDVVGNSSWVTGDWNGDAEFSSSDFIAALAYGRYEQGLDDAAMIFVPEPSYAGLSGLILVLIVSRLRVHPSCAP